MTATMPSWLARLLDKYLGLEPVVSTEAAQPRLRLHVLDRNADDPETLEQVAARARAGRNVLVCLNTVRGAIRVWSGLKEAAPDLRVMLLHSRFHARDRLAREQFLQESFGSAQRQGNARGMVVVATQVVEVSLDVDFDEGYSELAPPDALVQRMGRVNRRGRLQDAKFHLLYGAEAIDRAREVYAGARGATSGRMAVPASLFQTVLSRCLEWAREVNGNPVTEDDLRAWVDHAYGDEAGPALEIVALRSAEEFASTCIRRLTGWDGSPAYNFEALFGGAEVLPTGLEPEFDQLLQDSLLEALQLLVPVPQWALDRLKDSVRYRADVGVPVINAPYHEDRGLLI